MHITSITNGYGGKIVFEYEKEADNTTSKPWPYPATTGVEASAPKTHNETGGDSEGNNAWLEDYYYSTAPGGMYQLSADLVGGSSAQVSFVFQKGSEFHLESPLVTVTPGPAITTYSYNFKMPITTTNADINVQVRCTGYCSIRILKLALL